MPTDADGTKANEGNEEAKLEGRAGAPAVSVSNRRARRQTTQPESSGGGWSGLEF